MVLPPSCSAALCVLCGESSGLKIRARNSYRPRSLFSRGPAIHESPDGDNLPKPPGVTHPARRERTMSNSNEQPGSSSDKVANVVALLLEALGLKPDAGAPSGEVPAGA